MPQQTEEQILRHLQRMTALNQILLASSSSQDLRTLIEVILEKIDLVLHYPMTTIRLWNDETEELEPTACRNLNEREWRLRKIEDGEGLAELFVDKQTPLVISDIQQDPRVPEPEFFRKQGVASCLRIPLIAKGELLGVLSFYTPERNPFTEEEIEFLRSLGSQVAIAIYIFFPVRTPSSLGQAETPQSGRRELIRTISHEIRTRLTSLMGYTGMMRDNIFGHINPRQRRALDKVMTNAYDLLTITEKLEATKIEDLKQEVVAGSRPLNKAIEEFEREAILGALQKTGFNQTKAASLLGTSRSILRYRMGKLKIKSENLRTRRPREEVK